MAERTSSVIAGDGPTNPPSLDSNQNDAGFQEEFLRLSNIFLKPDYLSSLPVELVLEIIEELADDTASLGKLAATSRILQAIIEPVLYRRHVEAAIGGPSPVAPRALIHDAYNNLPRTVEKCVDATNVRFDIDLRYYSASSNIYGYPDGTGSALHFAAHGGGTAVVDLLLNLGANINAPGKLECDYPVADQLTLSNINRIDRDYGRISPSDPDPDSTRWFIFRDAGWLPLHFALCQGHTNTALLLMERGANYRTRIGNFGQPHDEPVCAVHLVAAKGHDSKTYEYTLEMMKKGDGDWNKYHYTTMEDLVNFPDSRGTPLHHAVIGSIEHGVQHIEKLLNLGADVDAKDFNGPPPISLAVKNGLWDAAVVLLSHGANMVPPPDIALESYHGRYPGWNHVLIDAIWSHEHMYHTPTDQWRGDYQLPNNDDEFRQWARKRHAFISETVQTRDSDLNTVYAQTGHTPVTWAALNAKWKTETSELVWILWNLGASLDAQNLNGDTALHALCRGISLCVDRDEAVEPEDIINLITSYLDMYQGDNSCLVRQKKALQTPLSIAGDPCSLNAEPSSDGARFRTSDSRLVRLQVLGLFLQHSASSIEPVDPGFVWEIGEAIMRGADTPSNRSGW